MQVTIRKILKDRNSLVAKTSIANMFGQQELDNGAELTRAVKQVAMIETWLELLSEDEKFVLEKHLIEGIDWGRVNHLYSQYWGGEFTRCEKTLSNYQARALSKIENFCLEYKEIFDFLFEEYY